MATFYRQRKTRRWSSDRVVVISKKKPNRPSQPASIKKNEIPSPSQPKKRSIDPELFSSITHQINNILPDPPFKIGIGSDISKKLAGTCGVSKRMLRRIINIHMRYITGLERYLKAASNATHRHGLDGSKTKMEEEHRKQAEMRLKRLKAKQSKHGTRDYKR